MRKGRGHRRKSPRRRRGLPEPGARGQLQSCSEAAANPWAAVASCQQQHDPVAAPVMWEKSRTSRSNVLNPYFNEISMFTLSNALLYRWRQLWHDWKRKERHVVPTNWTGAGETVYLLVKDPVEAPDALPITWTIKVRHSKCLLLQEGENPGQWVQRAAICDASTSYRSLPLKSSGGKHLLSTPHSSYFGVVSEVLLIAKDRRLYSEKTAWVELKTWAGKLGPLLCHAWLTLLQEEDEGTSYGFDSVSATG